MKHRTTGNYLKAHRKKSGLSQRELAKLVGYKGPDQVSRHERAASIPPFAAALAYELIFRSPVSEIFASTRDDIARGVETQLATMRQDFESRNARSRDAALTAQKLMWLSTRKQSRLRS